MKTSQEEAAKILEQMQAVAEARLRPMMGGYIVYVDEKVVGQLNEGELFIKVTEFGESFASDLQQKPPYTGAKPAYVVPQAKIDNQAWLQKFIAGTVKELPAPKKK